MELSKLGRVGDLDDLELLHAKDLQPAGVKPCVSWRALTRNVSVGRTKSARARVRVGEARTYGRLPALRKAGSATVATGAAIPAKPARIVVKQSNLNAKERARGTGRVQREGAKAERDREGKGEGEGEGRRGTGRENERTRESGPQGDLWGVHGEGLGDNRKNGRAFLGSRLLDPPPSESPSLSSPRRGGFGPYRRRARALRWLRVRPRTSMRGRSCIDATVVAVVRRT